MQKTGFEIGSDLIKIALWGSALKGGLQLAKNLYKAPMKITPTLRALRVNNPTNTRLRNYWDTTKSVFDKHNLGKGITTPQKEALKKVKRYGTWGGVTAGGAYLGNAMYHSGENDSTNNNNYYNQQPPGYYQ